MQRVHEIFLLFRPAFSFCNQFLSLFTGFSWIKLMANLPMVIVLALGGAAAGGPDALRLLLHVAGRSAAADVVIAVFLIGAMTAVVLGTMLLARYVRVAACVNNGTAALRPGTARLARVTMAVALAVVIVVAACLLALPSTAAGRGGEASSCSA